MTVWKDYAKKVVAVFLAICIHMETVRCLKCYMCDTTSGSFQEANKKCNSHSLRDCPDPTSGACMIETYRVPIGRAQVVKQCLRQCPVYVNTTAQHIRCCMQDGCNDVIITPPSPRNQNALLPPLPSPDGGPDSDPNARPPNLRPPNQRGPNHPPNRHPNRHPNDGPPEHGQPALGPRGGGPNGRGIPGRGGSPPPPGSRPSPRPGPDTSRKHPEADGKMHEKMPGKGRAKNGAGSGNKNGGVPGGTKRKQNQGKKKPTEDTDNGVGGTGGVMGVVTIATLAALALL